MMRISKQDNIKKLMKYVFSLTVVSMLFSFQIPKVYSNILEGLKKNDSKAVVKYFGSTVNLSLNGQDRISTKFQSELILNNFFKDYPINTIKIVSNGGNGQSTSYVVYGIKTIKENFQIVVKFMEIKGETTVVEFKMY